MVGIKRNHLKLNSSEFDRRTLLRGAFSCGASLAVGNIPTVAHAESLCRICQLSRLHPARFLAGIIFDTVSSIIINEVSNAVLSSLVFSKTGGRTRNNYAGFPRNEYHKGALIVAGETDYGVYENLRLKSLLLINNRNQQKRIDSIKNFIYDEGIYIKSAYTSISYPIDEFTSLDDLLSIEYFTSPRRRISDADVMDEIERQSGTTAVQKWLGL